MKLINNINYLSDDNLIFLKEKDCVNHERSLLIKKLHVNLVELDFFKNLELFSKFKGIKNADKTLSCFLNFLVLKLFLIRYRKVYFFILIIIFI